MDKNIHPVCIHFAVFLNPIPLLIKTPSSIRTKVYFHCCLNQISKPLRCSSYILKIEKQREYRLNYSYDLLIKLIEKLSYKPFCKHCKLVYMYFYCLCLCEAKTAVQKYWVVFYICFSWFWVAFGVPVLKVMCFWCSFCKVIGNQGFFSYNRYNLLGIATVL